MGESRAGSADIVSDGEACVGGELDAIVLRASVVGPSESICSIIIKERSLHHDIFCVQVRVERLAAMDTAINFPPSKYSLLCHFPGTIFPH